MKIFSNGSSFASGSYPKYLAELLSADLTNISTPGYSNRSIWRTTIEFNPQNYDLAVIQLTSRSRTEYYDDRKKWMEISSQLTHPLLGDKKKLWSFWYENLYTDEYGECEEKFAVQGIRDHFTINNIPCIMMTTDKYTTSTDFDVNIFDIDFPMDKTRHPTDKGHQIIAKRIYETFISGM
jgi:hypothetical protein